MLTLASMNQFVEKRNIVYYLAQFISLIIHPLFLYFFMLLTVMTFLPFLFYNMDTQAQNKMLILNAIYTILFPSVAIFLLYKLELIGSVQMDNSKDRIGPYIASAIFYSWTYINLRNSPLMPEIMTTALLGVLIGLYLGFFINNFDKISVHGMGTGGLLAFTWLLNLEYGSERLFQLNVGGLMYGIYPSALFVFAIISFALVAWARMYLKKHNLRQVLTGNLLGIFGFYMAQVFT